MSRNTYRRLFVMGLCITMFITFGFSNRNTYQSRIDSSSNRFINTEYPERAPSKAMSLTKNEPSYSQQVKHHNQVHIASFLPSQPKGMVIQEQIPMYEVTAHYLNVRAKPNANSMILNVIKQGDRVEINEFNVDGWLQLKEGGYIHGGYVKKIDESIDPSMEPMNSELKKWLTTKDEEPSKPTSKVKSISGLSEEHISTIFKGTALEDEGLEEVILDIEQEYGINAYFTTAVLKLESGNGKSRLAKNKNNLFGLNAIDGDAHRKAFSFKTKGDSVRKFGQLISKNYVGKGYTTIDKVAKKYCPSNKKWPSLVTTIMKSDYQKL